MRVAYVAKVSHPARIHKVQPVSTLSQAHDSLTLA